MSKHGENMKKAIADEKKHPKKFGMRMQVHHLISKHSITLISTNIKNALDDKGYDIDDLGNLVSLPNDFQGACHLAVQIHRGDHKKAKKNLDGHDETYHVSVKDLLDKKFRKGLNDYCDTRSLQKEMNRQSTKILRKINSFKWSLTNKNISDSFLKDALTGCCHLPERANMEQFRANNKEGKLCPTKSRNNKKGILGRANKSHFPDSLKRYELKTGY